MQVVAQNGTKVEPGSLLGFGEVKQKLMLGTKLPKAMFITKLRCPMMQQVCCGYVSVKSQQKKAGPKPMEM